MKGKESWESALTPEINIYQEGLLEAYPNCQFNAGPYGKPVGKKASLICIA